MPKSDEKAPDPNQKAAADSLRKQISELVDGTPRPARPSSLRDFVERRMAEDRKSEKVEGEKCAEDGEDPVGEK
jgi:hypothetical protein